MTTGVDIPVSIVGDAAAVAALHRIEDALKGAGTSAATAEPKVQSLGERFAGLGTAARHVNELREFVVTLGTALVATAQHIADLTSEQQRLTANSTRLGLDFGAAARQAGGFVSEMQTMTLATSLADRGIRATQEELNALSRVGMSRAAATGKNLEEVFDSLTDSVLEGGEEMGKFGGNLLSVSDSSHTAGERMAAFVTHARTVTPAMRTAADEMARFRNEVHNAQRTIGTAFAEEFARLTALPGAMEESADKARDFNDTLRAIGMTAANIVTVIGGATTAAIGFMVAGVGALVGSVRVLVAGIGALPRGVSAARSAMSAASNEAFGPDSFVSTIGRFSEAAGRAALGALGGGPDRTSATPENMPTLASVREQRARDRRERERRERNASSGTPQSEVDLARIEAGIAMAERMGGAQREARFGTDYQEIAGIVVGAVDILGRLRRQRIENLEGQTRESRSGESGADRRRRVAGLRARIDELKTELRNAEQGAGREARSAFARQSDTARQDYERAMEPVRNRAQESLDKDRETRMEQEERDYERSDEGLRSRAEADRTKAREERDLADRRDSYRTFTDEMEALSGRRVNVAREEAQFVNNAFQSMGRAFSDHLTAFIEGREELGAALQGMLSDTLKAISQEAAVKAGLELASGFAALASYRFDAAASHFAASGIFTAVAAASGLAGGAIAPKAANASAASASGAARSAAPMSSPSSEKAAGITVNVAFNGPQYGTGGVVQAANDLVRVINTGALQGGSQINRLAVGATGRA